MKKIILVGLMAVSFNAFAISAAMQGAKSRLCGSVAELAGTVAEARKQGASWAELEKAVNMRGKTGTDPIVMSVLRDAYYQGLPKDIAESLAYTSCMSQVSTLE